MPQAPTITVFVYVDHNRPLEQHDLPRCRESVCRPGAASADHRSPTAIPPTATSPPKPAARLAPTKTAVPTVTAHADGNHDCHGHAYPNPDVHADDHADADRHLYADSYAHLNAAAAAKSHAGRRDCHRTAAPNPTGPASPLILLGGLAALGCAGLLGIALVVSKRR